MTTSIKHLVSSALLSTTFGCITLAAHATTPGTVSSKSTGIEISSAASATSTTTTIAHTDSHAIINWNSFNIAAGDTVVFDQSAAAVTLNRVAVNGGISQINGNINSNGRVFILNPNGVVFGNGAKVNVGSLLASSMDMSDDDFLADNYKLTAVDGKYSHVANHGTIHAASAGYVALVGETVANTGTIHAQYGSVVLAAGRIATASFNGGLISFHINANGKDSANSQGGSIADAVSNSGEIHANGGTVTLTTKVASDIFTHAVNNTGVIHATHISGHGDDMYLNGNIRAEAYGGDINIAGELNNDTDGNPATISIGSRTHDAFINTDLSSDSYLIVLAKGTIHTAENTTLASAGMLMQADYFDLQGQIKLSQSGGAIIILSNRRSQPTAYNTTIDSILPHIELPANNYLIFQLGRESGSYNTTELAEIQQSKANIAAQPHEIQAALNIASQPSIKSLATNNRSNDHTNKHHLEHHHPVYAHKLNMKASAFQAQVTANASLLPTNSKDISLAIIPHDMLLPTNEL